MVCLKWTGWSDRLLKINRHVIGFVAPKHLMAVPQDLKDDVERLVNKVGEWMNGRAQESAPLHSLLHFESAQSLSNYDVQYLWMIQINIKCYISSDMLILILWSSCFCCSCFCCDMDCRWMPPGQGAELRVGTCWGQKGWGFSTFEALMEMGGGSRNFCWIDSIGKLRWVQP